MHFLLNIVAVGQESSMHADLEQCRRAKELEFSIKRACECGWFGFGLGGGGGVIFI